jgi:hypothetical protein
VGFNGFKGLQTTPCFLHGVSHESRAVTFPDDDRRSTDDDRRSPRGVIVRKYVPTVSNAEQVMTLKEQLMETGNELDGLRPAVEEIKNHLAEVTARNEKTNRRKKWRLFRQHIVDMTNETFYDILNHKGSSEGLEFSHEDRTLDLNV